METDQSVSKTVTSAKTLTKGEQTRQKIVEQAAQIFNRRGYNGGSMSELMDATGLKKGGIYRHFSSKEELALEAFDYSWKAVWDAQMDQVDDNVTGVAKLKQTIATFIHHRPAVAGGCPIMNTAVDSDDGNRLLRARVVKALKGWVGYLESIVVHAIEQGEIQPDAEPRAVATIIVATLEGALMMSRLERNDSALRRVQKHLENYLDKQIASSH
jgi:TetR/AcrR family transcriptional repressor of nem operon